MSPMYFASVAHVSRPRLINTITFSVHSAAVEAISGYAVDGLREVRLDGSHPRCADRCTGHRHSWNDGKETRTYIYIYICMYVLCMRATIISNLNVLKHLKP